MMSFILAGVLVSGSTSQTVSSSHGRLGTSGGGAIIGARVTIDKTFPRPIVNQNLHAPSGTQTVQYCDAKLGGKDVKLATTDPRGCAFGSLWLP